jgi:PEP-CTERM motif
MSTDNGMRLVLLLVVLASPAWGNPVAFQNQGGPIARRDPVARLNGTGNRCSAGPGAVTPCSIYAGSLFKGTFGRGVTTKTDHARVRRHRSSVHYGSLGALGVFGIDPAFSLPLDLTEVDKADEHSSAVNLASGSEPVSLPEPGSLGLLATGLVGIAFVLRRRI